MPMHNKFTILQTIEAMSHQGTLVSTSLLTSQVVKNSLTAKKKLYYMTDIDWLRINNFSFDQMIGIFHDKEIEIVTRSKSHENIVSKMFKPPVGTVFNWRADEILKVI